MFLEICGHAYAGIAYREMDMAQIILFPIIFNDKIYRAIRRGIFYGIGQQIEKNLIEACSVSQYAAVFRNIRLDGEADIFFFTERLDDLADLLQKVL